MIGKDDIRQLEQDNEYWKNELKKSNDINSELMVVQLQLEQKNERLRDSLLEMKRWIDNIKSTRNLMEAKFKEIIETALEEK